MVGSAIGRFDSSANFWWLSSMANACSPTRLQADIEVSGEFLGRLSHP